MTNSCAVEVSRSIADSLNLAACLVDGAVDLVLAVPPGLLYMKTACTTRYSLLGHDLVGREGVPRSTEVLSVVRDRLSI